MDYNWWFCKNCGSMNSRHISICSECGVSNSKISIVPAFPDTKMRPGDWLCNKCNVLIFASKSECRRCKTKKPSFNQLTVSELNKSNINRKHGD